MKRTVAVGCLLVLTALAFVAGRRSGGSGASHPESSKHILYYVDPMHPSYRSDKPGTAPDCGMELTPVYSDAEAGKGPRSAPGSVVVDPGTQALIGVRVESVGRRSEPRSVRTTGRVEADSDRLYRLMAGAEGWVESVQNNPVGTLVQKNELLATLYSREFRNAQQAFLGSLSSLERIRSSNDPHDAGKGSDASLRINEEQLRALGMGELQLKELRQTRRITSEITVNSPIDGIVLGREISPGQRFEVGSEFYRIADLSTVWITADLFGKDSQEFHPGARVRVAVRERAESVYATVSKAPPYFDPQSRTLKVRLEAENPGLALRPGMFVDLELPVEAAPALTVPVEALLDSGLSERVFVERATGEFEPRPVKTGWRADDRVEIVSGLREGERVAVSGTFLLDSESRFKTAAAGIHEAASEVADSSPKVRERMPKGEVRDPKCGMKVDAVDAAAAGLKGSYRGATYYFCSSGCKEEFEKAPERYLKPASVLAAVQRSAGHD
ncbi:MAG: efflux RND transporter periplasmic adaptor subunit [Acidobacteriia bacterium]|nr:efflux RND transporter periplasmic adaptor subunit [Terriglobia bacterium]